MKNKYVKYGLLIVVTLVWGSIIINYFGLFSGDENMIYIPKKVIEPTRKQNITKNYELKLDYEDPFLSENMIIVRQKAKVNPIAIVAPKKNIIPSSKQELKVRYKGLVKNKNSSKKTGIITIDGKSHLITTNYKTKLISIISFNDSVCKYNYDGKIIKALK